MTAERLARWQWHGPPLAEAALRSGNQAHMTRAFRRPGGATPGASDA